MEEAIKTLELKQSEAKVMLHKAIHEVRVSTAKLKSGLEKLGVPVADISQFACKPK